MYDPGVQCLPIGHHDLGRLPHFNPDLEERPPPEVTELRERVGQAGGLLISCPEYVRGIPGSFKNALDWSEPDFLPDSRAPA